MVSPQLLDYVRQYLSAGATKEEISKTLIASGWQVSDINEAFNVPTSPQTWKKMKLTDPINPKAVSVMASVGSVILFLVGLIILGVVCLFLRGLSTFRFDSMASFYPLADLFISLLLLFVIPIAVLVRSLRKNRTVFSIQAVIYMLFIGTGILFTYTQVISNAWQDFCVSQANQARPLETFYQEYCKSHPAPVLALFDHTIENFLGFGGVSGIYVFRNNDTGGIPWDVQSYVEEANKEAMIYSQGTAVSDDVSCNYAIDRSLYNKNISQGMNVLGDGTFTLVTSMNTKNVNLKSICAGLLPKPMVIGTNWSGTGYGMCTYDLVPASSDISIERFLFDTDPKEYKNLLCLQKVSLNTSTFTLKDIYVNGLLQN